MAQKFVRMGTNPIFAALLWVVLAFMVFASPARAANAVLTSDEVLARTGTSIAEWGAEWWQWAFENPAVLGDKTGKLGPLGNVGGPVFFAEGSGGTPVNVKYTVPAGQYILLPVATFIWTFFPPCAEVICATRIINENFIGGITGVSVEIDDVPVPNIASHLVRIDSNTSPFQVDAGPIGSDGYGGILDALQGGYWVMLEPLAPGSHRISMDATVPKLDGFTGEPLGGTDALRAKLRLEAKAFP